MNGIFLTEGGTQNMADKADKPPSKKSGPVTLIVSAASASQQPSMRIASSNSDLNLQGSSSTVDVTVKCTPSRSLPRLSTSVHHDHSYVKSARDLKELKEMKDLKAKALKNAKVMEKLMKDRRMLRMRNFRANKKIERLKRAVELEQQMHWETHHTLTAVMLRLHLQYPE